MDNMLKEIAGQNNAKESLEKIYSSSKIPHAFLFTGPEGVGKHYTAVKFIELLNSSRQAGKSDSPISTRIRNLSEPYVKFVIPLPRGKNESSENSPTEKLSNETLVQLKEELEKKSVNPYYKINLPGANNIKINSIRDVKKFLSLNYDEVKYRAVLISEAHLMNDEAQNALLKSLEEPPQGIIFILCTSNKSDLLPTIISRCWNVGFEPLSDSQIAGILVKHFGIDQTTADKVSHFSNGSVTRALDFIQHDFDSLIEKAISILRNAMALKFHTAHKEISQFTAGNSNESLNLLIQIILTWLDDSQRNKTGLNNYIFSNYSDTLDKFNARFNTVNVHEIMFRLSRLSSAMENNLNLNVIALNIIFELASIRYIGLKSA
ncbi:MAG: ATP-binding protein [Ignavibacteriales bacterium]